MNRRGFLRTFFASAAAAITQPAALLSAGAVAAPIKPRQLPWFFREPDYTALFETCRCLGEQMAYQREQQIIKMILKDRP